MLATGEEAAMRRRAEHPYSFGFVTDMARLLAPHRRIGQAFFRQFEQFMFVPGSLDRQEREFVVAVSVSAQTCFF
jgi:hypothetical protein